MNHDMLPKTGSIEAQQVTLDDAERLVCGVMGGIEGMSPLIYDQLSEPVVAQGIVEACRVDGEIRHDLLGSYLLHSNRFSEVSSGDRDVVFGEEVVIPQHDRNLHESGRLRREESGPRLKLEALAAVGVDPRYVLMFRVTQPGTEPKPELYWTSDPSETLHGLNVELGDRASSAIILMDSLASVAKNGGLIRDVNDDGGVAVRQIGHDTYDQKNALATIKRPDTGALSAWN